MIGRRILLALPLLVVAASLRADSAVIALAQSSYTFREDAGTGSVTLLRTGDKTVACSVNYHVTVDTVVVDATASFVANEVSKTISFPIPNDNAYDNRDNSLKNYFFSISGAVNALTGSPSSATIRIIDDESVPIATFHSTSVAEGDSGITLAPMTITLSGPLRAATSIDVFALGGSASVGTDYEGGSLPFIYLAQVPVAAGQTTVQFNIRVKGDTVPEPDETIVIGGGIGNFVLVPSGTLTILNDDYILVPDSLRIARGTASSAGVSVSVPTPTTDHVLLSSSDPGVATVPPFIDIPAGSLGKSFDVMAVGVGSTVITAIVPPSRGSGTTTAHVDVYTPTFYFFENPALSVPLGQTASATMHFDPPPSEPVVMFLSQTNPSIATIPPIFTIGTDGTGTFTLRGAGVGTTFIATTVPAFYGGGPTGFRMNVTPVTGFTIGRLDLTSGPSTGGQLVRIYGDGMSGRCTATFDGVSGQNTTLAAAGSFTTTTPPHDAGIVDISVRCGNDAGTLPKAYTYTPAPSRLARLSPTIGSISGGTLVAATGDNLRRGRCSLWFGGVTAATLQNGDTTTMLVAAPPHDPGSVDVTMRCGSDVSTIPGAFLYTSNELLPQLSGVNPSSAVPGDRVIVAGSAFRDDDAIFFDSAAGLDVTSTNETHFVTVPDLPPGNATITLRNVAGDVVAGPTFRVLSPTSPQITSAPTHVLTSSEFSVTGTGFRRDLNFLLGGTALQTIAIASTFGQLRLPPAIGPGTYDLTVANQSGVPRTIQVTDGISVTSVSLPCSSTEGGPVVTIAGNGFAAGAVVAFGATDSSDVTVIDAHTITARVPPSSGLASETITVTNPTGESAQLSNMFHYRWPDPGCGGRHRGAGH